MIDIKTQFSGLVTILMVCVAILSVQLVALFMSTSKNIIHVQTENNFTKPVQAKRQNIYKIFTFTLTKPHCLKLMKCLLQQLRCERKVHIVHHQVFWGKTSHINYWKYSVILHIKMSNKIYAFVLWSANSSGCISLNIHIKRVVGIEIL